MAGNLLVERLGAVGILTLNRPGSMNALSADLRRAICAAANEAAHDPDIRCLVLTGAGEKAFSAGLDLKELESDVSVFDASNAQSLDLNPVLALENCGKPVIGAINGVAITGGFELALACDIRIASTRARFGDTHVRVGVLPGWGLSQKLSRLAGLSRAKELSLTGNFIDAVTAQSWGIVNRVVEPDALLAAAVALANSICEIPPAMALAYKQLIDDGYKLPLEEALLLEQTRSLAHNTSASGETIAAQRTNLQTRARKQ